MSNYFNPITKKLVNVSISDLIKDHSRIIMGTDETGIILNRVHNIILWHDLETNSFDCGLYADSVTDIHNFSVSAADKSLIQAL